MVHAAMTSANIGRQIASIALTASVIIIAARSGSSDEMPGEETYQALKQLAKEHPEEKYRLWMAERARQRAISDAEEPLWNADQVPRFYKGSP
ncbi:hypothetical protein A4U53_038760 (plasmid) [Rhizobium ruizarguesonis]|uniref:Uncharacterized protein n=1 Tax=Rhizobium ruizarguesonis TaxID=2081791 RepID=A0ACD5EWN2_9HYPH|nr:hypothetical protein [Rhizobium leguminosarum]